MYQILTCSKDTYITNRLLESNDGKYANLGDASSLDLFKLKSENKLVKATSKLTFITNPSNGSKLTLVDNNNSSYVFTFNDSPPFSELDIGKSGSLSETLQSTYDKLNSHARFEAYDKDDKNILIRQLSAGFLGEKSNSSNALNEFTVSDFKIIEKSKILLHFDIDEIKNYFRTSANKTFKSKLILKDVTSGIVKPKDYTLEVFPLSQSFDEGIGRDVITLGHAGWANFITASNQNGVYNLWNLEGADSNGGLGEENIDIITGSSGTDYNCSQYFSKGDEDLEIDITNIVLEMLSGSLNNNGLAVQFSSSNLNDDYTYFVKRFGSRHVRNKKYSPRICFYFDDSYTKNSVVYTGVSTRIFLENKQGSLYRNLPFTSSNSSIDTDLNQLSASLVYNDFKQEIFATQSLDYLGQKEAGKYYVDLNLNMFEDKLHGYLTSSGDLTATLNWHILVDENPSLNTKVKSQTITISTGSNIQEEKTFIIPSVYHLESSKGSKTKKSFYVQFIDFIKNQDAIKIPYRRKGENLGSAYYKLIDADTGDILIPYEHEVGGTKMSFDDGKYIFDIYNIDFYKNKRINFEFYLKDYNDLIIKSEEVFRL